MIHHGLDTQPKQGAKGGVAIILSEETANLWKLSKSNIRRGGILTGNTMRLLAVDFTLKIKSHNKTKTHAL